MVLIARSIAQQAPVMLMDEPISHLDFKNQVYVLKLVRRLASELNLTVLLTLHDPNMAATFSDHLILMKDGVVLRTGRKEDTLHPDYLTHLYDVEIAATSGSPKLIYPKESGE